MYTKSLRTSDPSHAGRVKDDVEAQLDRISRGRSPIASMLLSEGFSIVDVLFGSPQTISRLDNDSKGNPNSIADLFEGYLGALDERVGFDQSYNSKLWLKRIK